MVMMIRRRIILCGAKLEQALDERIDISETRVCLSKSSRWPESGEKLKCGLLRTSRQYWPYGDTAKAALSYDTYFPMAMFGRLAKSLSFVVNHSFTNSQLLTTKARC